MKRILIADDEQVANSIQSGLLSDLEGITCDVVYFGQVNKIVPDYDLVITDPVLFNLNYQEPFNDVNPYFLVIKELFQKRVPVCFATGEKFSFINRLFGSLDISQCSYTQKPFDTMTFSKYVGRFLDVHCKLKLDLLDELESDESSFGPISRS